MSRSAENYNKPEIFMPERFMDDLSHQLHISVNASIEKRDQFMFCWGRRMCPGVHLAEVQMFHIWVRVFATSTIVPPLDEKERPVYPDLDNCYDGGIIVKPLKSRLRFVERSDCLI
ncbi:hypothetical protein BDB00DRAFT_509887 [Zychaea mexicana]|uniref:uncharacterized protein n=1 Tax=Zychaea mexicana TaxID=64656 RepID=UPI0022FEECB1|nr:uncharacterized protein BDB00DRAFT_509887 [Zychaea mexicana]KAI9491311.1 hypothetical protein BDB00DRAFT_509887 [Zychaea mexicana]